MSLLLTMYCKLALVNPSELSSPYVVHPLPSVVYSVSCARTAVVPASMAISINKHFMTDSVELGLPKIEHLFSIFKCRGNKDATAIGAAATGVEVFELAC